MRNMLRWLSLSLLLVPAAVAGGEAPQGPRQAARTDRYGDPLPEGALARTGTVRLHHPDRVDAIAFSPDGKALASGGGGGDVMDGAVRLWDPATGRELRRFAGAYIAILAVAFSPDGKTLAAGGWSSSGEPGMITLWDVATGKKRSRLVGHTDWIDCLSFSPDGRVLASGARDKTVRLWDVAPRGEGNASVPLRPSGKEIRQLRGHGDMVLSVAFSPDGKTLASASAWEDRTIRLWDVAGGKQRAVLRGPGKGYFGATSVCFSPDGKTLASSGAAETYFDMKQPQDPAGHLWDVATGRELRTFEGGKNAPGSVTFSPDGKTVAVPAGAAVRLWEVATGKETRPLRTKRGELGRVVYSPDGKLLAATSGRSIRLWDVTTSKELFPPVEEHEGRVWSVALSPDGKVLASCGGYEDAVRLWHAASCRPLRRLQTQGLWVEAVAFSPDGKLLAARNARGTVCLWRTDTWAEVRRLKGLSGPLTFSPDSKRLASGGGGGARVVEVSTGRELRRFAAEQQTTECIAFSADGKLLGLGDDLWRVYLWDTATGKKLSRFVEPEGLGSAHALAFSPDCKILAGVGERVHLFEATTGREVGGWKLPEGLSPFALAFSPDGKTLAVGDIAGPISLWETATGRERRRFARHEGPVKSVAFSADGRTLASGGADGIALVWDVTGKFAGGRPLAAHSPADLERLWADLAGSDAGRAYRAVWALALNPGPGLPFLRDRLRPVVPADPEQTARLIARLGSDEFAVREKASRELARLGEPAGPALRAALAKKPPLEVRRRIDLLLERLRQAPSGERLRAIRAVEALEGTGSREARRLLRRLAGGAPEATLTREAKAALGRLNRRSGPSP